MSEASKGYCASRNGRGPRWSEFADAVIISKYPGGGAEAVMRLLVDRSPSAIKSRASRLGVVKDGQGSGAASSRGFSVLPVQDSAPAHRAWMLVDRAIRPYSRPAVLGAAI